MDKAIYSQKAPKRGNAGVRVIAFALILAVFCVLLFVAACLPYSGILTLLVIAVFAFTTNALMKNLVFDITYVLYEDRLVFKRRYGRIEMEMESFPLSEAKITSTGIEYDNKSYEFSPDEKLKELLGI